MFEIYTNQKNGEFYFRLKARNGEIVLGSEGYTTKAACKNGIESVQKNAPLDKRYETKEAKNGKFHFNLKSGNGQVIGSSQMYASLSGLKNGIESVKRNAQGRVVDVTKGTRIEVLKKTTPPPQTKEDVELLEEEYGDYCGKSTIWGAREVLWETTKQLRHFLSTSKGYIKKQICSLLSFLTSNKPTDE